MFELGNIEMQATLVVHNTTFESLFEELICGTEFEN